MKLCEFMNLYDNWNGILVVNDDNLNPIAKGEIPIVLFSGGVYNMEVISFGFHDNELCVRVR